MFEGDNRLPIFRIADTCFHATTALGRAQRPAPTAENFIFHHSRKTTQASPFFKKSTIYFFNTLTRPPHKEAGALVCLHLFHIKFREVVEPQAGEPPAEHGAAVNAEIVLAAVDFRCACQTHGRRVPDNKICVCIVKLAFGKVRPRPHKVKCGIGGQRLAGMKIPKPRVDEHKGVFPRLGSLVKR